MQTRNRNGPGERTDPPDLDYPNWSRTDSTKKRGFFASLRHGFSEILVLLLLGAAVAILLTAFLYALSFAWDLYKSTAVGGRFLSTYDTPRFVGFLAFEKIPILAFWTSLISLGTSLSIAGISHFLDLSPLYMKCGKSARFIFWRLPLIWLTAMIIQKTGLTDTIEAAFWLALLPTLCFLGRSFRFVFANLPELGLFLTAYPTLLRIWDALH